MRPIVMWRYRVSVSAMSETPIPLSAEMDDQGYWVVTWSLRAGLRAPVTCAKVGITRSEAIDLTRAALPAVPRRWDR